MTTLDRAVKIPEHKHSASVYVHCLDCFMFGIPLPFNWTEPVQCGNCKSFRTNKYYPQCCVSQALLEVVEENKKQSKALIEAEEIIESINYRNKARNEWLERHGTKT